MFGIAEPAEESNSRSAIAMATVLEWSGGLFCPRLGRRWLKWYLTESGQWA